MKCLSFAALLFTAATPVLAQPAGGPPQPLPHPSPDSEPRHVIGPRDTGPDRPPVVATARQTRVNQLIVYGNDPCPRSSDEEIIVCARKPEGERFRIPENLRDEGNPSVQAWANKATELSYVGKTGTNSCSTVGGGGFTGCLGQIINAASAERQTRDSVDWNKLIAEARDERLGRIDAESDAIERQQVQEEKAQAAQAPK